VKNALLCGGSALAVALSFGVSQTYAATATATAASSGAAEVSELTVVAEKREERIETVPVAITAFSAKQRDLLGLKTVQEISDFTPGLSYYAIADRAYIRGIGRNTVNLATAAGVAIYYNGIYYGANGSVSLQHDSLFIGNVEVDRGPQNTLHGSNADGGVINYIEKRPTSSFYAEGRFGVQQYGYYTGEAVVSGPISDNWRVRAGGQYAVQNGGFFKNFDGPPEGGVGPQGNGGRWYYLEGQIEGKIGDHLDVWGMASTGDFDTNFHTVATNGNIPETPNLQAGAGGLYPSDFYGLCAINAATHPECGVSGTVGSVVPGSAVGFPVLASTFPGNNPSNLNLHNFIETSTQHNTENKNLALATTWTYHLPTLDIEYLGGYQTFDYNLMFGPGIDSGLTSYQIQGPAGLGNATVFPAAAHTLFIEEDTSFSNEINFISTGSSPFQYLLGAYWFHEHFQQPIGAGCTPFQPQAFASNTLLGGPAPVNPDGCFFNQNGIITYNDYAGFAHGSYKFNDQFNIEGGIRYTSDHREGIETQRLISFTGTGGANSTSTDITRFLDAGLLGGVPAAFFLPCGTAVANGVPGAGPSSINCATGNIQRSLSGSWSAVTGDATVNWTPDPSVLAYFRYARGYKAGGFAAGTFEGKAATATTAAVPAFTAPEYVDSFEVGLKKTIGSTLTANAALFYYNFTNDQQPLGVVEGTGATSVVVTQLFNIPAVREYGFELEGSWHPIDPLTFTFEYSYLSAKVSSMNGLCVVDSADPNGVLAGENHTGCDPTKPGQQNIVGSTLPEAPPNKVALNALYAFKFDQGKLTLSVSGIWKDSTYGEIFNRPLNLAAPYYTINLRAVYDDAQDRYTVIGFINNVTNTTGFDNVTQTRLGTGTNLSNLALVQGVGITAPFVVGAEVQVRFR
jgi:iron complex outermembrane receptor protein